ncbi:SURF1 family cytochrome oxidase biogenesis protein [Lysinibacter cavernae]|uniref:SURF1-like protein n=1 Tax=Lysinibacter cavernae TaxID=1640652 RepID=A0A7X5QZF2_9MICO|nr:SURF1 family protein [Lysinibacter cavernae]NIH52816.1 cytochrome oxidase assembly protein ShyY1 [Lysinibacter cavernae]
MTRSPELEQQTEGWRFLLSRRWAGYLCLTIVFAIVCCLLGNWQFARRAEARAEIARIDANYDAAVVPLQQALPELDSYDDETQKWSQVTASGTYLTEHQTLVRIRPLNGSPGFEVLVPLLLDDGSVFIVDRGWLPAGSTTDSPDIVPDAPEGRVTVIARLKAGEPELASRTAGEGQIATIHLPDMANRVDKPAFTGAYGLLVSEDPSVELTPVLATKPERDEGPHLSYALQWYVFALMGFIGLGWAARQEYRNINAADPEERERARKRAEKARLKRTDSEIEDELLDA